MDDFENIMNDNFDAQALMLSQTADLIKKVVDSAGEVHSHATGIGLPDALANEFAVLYFEMVVGMGDDGE